MFCGHACAAWQPCEFVFAAAMVELQLRMVVWRSPRSKVQLHQHAEDTLSWLTRKYKKDEAPLNV